MGNCCKLVKKEPPHIKEVAKPVQDSGTMLTEDRSQRSKILQITCENPKIHLSIRYRSAIPIQDLKEQIISEFPNLDISKYSLFRDDFEILDATATLHQLGILPGDTLSLRISEVSDYSEDIIASENNSIPVMNEEIITHEISTGKRGLAARTSQENLMTSPKKPAQELWRTALPSPPTRQLIKCDHLDASSYTNNTHDRSLKPPQATFQVKIPVGMMMAESDESNIEEKKNPGYFKDLQGPFFMFQKE